MLGLAIGSAVASLGSSIWGASQSAKAAKAQQEALNAKAARDNARSLYLQNVSEVDTKRGQNTIRIARDAAQKQWKQTQGAAAVGGGTDAAVAQAKEAGNRMISDAVAQVAAQDTARQEKALEMQAQSDAANTQAQMAIDAQKAQSTAQLASGMSNAFAQAGAAAMEARSGNTTANTASQPKYNISPAQGVTTSKSPATTITAPDGKINVSPSFLPQTNQAELVNRLTDGYGSKFTNRRYIPSAFPNLIH